MKNLFLSLFFMCSYHLNAQETIKGIILDKEERPLINATIYKDGKVSEGYAITSYDGRFEMQAFMGDTLIVSCIGYENKKIVVESAKLAVTLQIERQNKTIVTGLGISRSEQELGYAIQSIHAEKIAYSKTYNFLQALAGRAVGVQVKSSSAGPSSAVSILIRGDASLTGSNQPLFVLNGMPITNDLFSSGDGLNGSSTIDFGNAVQTISVDDIKSISVLRGASAAIAYGSRAANGVVLITTKNVEGHNGWEVEINSSTNFETILKLPDYQNEYGFGGYGKYSYKDGTVYTGVHYDAFGENWGPKLNGQLIKQWNSNGKAIPFVAKPNNIRDFYRIGVNTINNIALTHGGKDNDFRLSFSSLYKDDIVPNSNLHRTTMLASFGQKVGKKVRFRANALYTLTGSENIPNSGYDQSSSLTYGWLWFPRNGNLEDYKNYWKTGRKNIEQRYVEELWVNNPWMIVNENTNSFLTHRFIASTSINVQIIPKLTARVRGSADVRTENRYFKRAYSTKALPFGSYRQDNIGFSELNLETLLSYESSPKEEEAPFRFTGTFMFNMMRQEGSFLKVNAPQLNIANTYNLGNSKTAILVDDYRYKKGINSIFGIATLSYKTMVHLELAGRRDKYSTVSPGAFLGGYQYPSITLSTVFTEIFRLPARSILNFAKLRLSYGQVQADAAAYQLKNFYTYDNSWGTNSLLGSSPQLNNINLRPESTESYESGVELRFFKNKLSIDLTFYHNISKNLLLNLPTPISSGYNSKVFNAGEIQNTGLEILINATPIKKQLFSWNVTLTTSFNQNKVISLGSGINHYPMVSDMFPRDRGSNLVLEAEVGKPLGQLVGLGFQRDDKGQIIHENGLPLLTKERVSAGTYQPDALVGIGNTIRYQNFAISFLFDGQIGGKIYSRTHALANTGGTITNNDDPHLSLSTLDGREEYNISYDGGGNPIYSLVQKGGVVGQGVMYDSLGQLVPNTVSIPTRDYFYAYYGNGSNRDNIEAATYDATYIKLREVRISYHLPKKFLKRIRLKNATISLIGRNLALFSTVPSIDPETFSIRANKIVHGFESGQLPPTSSWGINLKLKF